MLFIRLFVSVIVFFGYSYLYAATSCPQEKCVAIVDVGSTGSRVHIYSYDTDANHFPIAITERWSKKITPGLATLESKQSVIDTYLDTLLKESPVKEVPVYFLATAGMRLLSKPQQQERYYLVSDWFKRQADWQLATSKTISGSEEGLFAWLSVNYQLGHLLDNKDLVGVMDMGGASVQVAFPVTNDSTIASDDVQDMVIYGHHLKIFVHSFLGLGQTEISHQLMDAEPCFVNGYELPNGQKANGDALSCKREVATLVNSVHHVNEVVQPALNTNPVSDWYVMGALAELVKHKLFDASSTPFTSQNLLNKADADVCHQSWPLLHSEYSDNPYLFGYCLFPSYFYALMVDGYGIQPNQLLSVTSTDKNNDWTMGVVLWLPRA